MSYPNRHRLLTIFFLRLLVFLADTWLHLTTKTVQYIIVEADSNLYGDYSASLHLFSRALPPGCTEFDNNTFGDTICILNPRGSAIFLINSSLAHETLSNVFSTHSVNLVNDDTSIYAFLAPTNLSSITASNDYFASILALTTQYTPVSQVCNLRGAFGSSTPFPCPSGFSGDVTAHFWNKQFFDNSSSNNPFTSAFAALYPDGGSNRLQMTPRSSL